MPPLSPAKLAATSSLWFAWNAHWLLITSTILPNQVATLLGGDEAQTELSAGAILAAGAMVSLVVTPLAGALSDRGRGRRGRRLPFLAWGVGGTCVALALLDWAGRATGLLPLLLAYLNLQFWWNWAAGPFAGLIPDTVPRTQHETASGWMNALGIMGMIIGNLLMLVLYRPEQPTAMLVALGVLDLLCLGVTLAWVAAPPAPAPPPWAGLAVFLRSFYIPLSGHRDFYLVLVTRLLNNMGIWSIFVFLVFYLQYVLGLSKDEASQFLPALMAAGAIVGIPASLAAAPLARRFGIVRVVQGSSWVMAASAAAYTMIALAPSVALVIPAVLVFSVANGVFGAADWALALRVLPSGRDAGKDFGIWHVCMVLPQVAGPLTSGAVIAWTKQALSAPFAYGLAFGLATAWFALASAFVGRVRVAG